MLALGSYPLSAAPLDPFVLSLTTLLIYTLGVVLAQLYRRGQNRRRSVRRLQ